LDAARLARSTEVFPVRAFNVYDVDTRNLKTRLERRPHRTPPSIRLETFPI